MLEPVTLRFISKDNLGVMIYEDLKKKVLLIATEYEILLKRLGLKPYEEMSILLA